MLPLFSHYNCATQNQLLSFHWKKIKAEKKGITLTSNVCEGYQFYVLGDSGRIGQVVLNLLSNAIKFTKVGGVNLQVDLISQDNSTAVTLTVRDTGIGIPDEAKSKLFQAFS